MPSLNNAMWALSLALQCSLVALIFARGLVPAMRAFTLLMGFYLLRSAVLFSLFGRIPGEAYSFLYTVLSALDILLQTLVAFELFLTAPMPQPRKRPSAAVFAGLVLASVALAWLVSASIQANPRSPIDRGVLFTSILFLAVFAVVRHRFAPSRHARLLQGFAVLGIAGICSQAGRTAAAFHRNAAVFTRWSYVEAIAYLSVLLFWLVALARSPARPPIMRAGVAI
jgi:hypothetical protein